MRSKISKLNGVEIEYDNEYEDKRVKVEDYEYKINGSFIIFTL